MSDKPREFWAGWIARHHRLDERVPSHLTKQQVQDWRDGWNLASRKQTLSYPFGDTTLPAEMKADGVSEELEDYLDLIFEEKVLKNATQQVRWDSNKG